MLLFILSKKRQTASTSLNTDSSSKIGMAWLLASFWMDKIMWWLPHNMILGQKALMLLLLSWLLSELSPIVVWPEECINIYISSPLPRYYLFELVYGEGPDIFTWGYISMRSLRLAAQTFSISSHWVDHLSWSLSTWNIFSFWSARQKIARPSV